MSKYASLYIVKLSGFRRFAEFLSFFTSATSCAKQNSKTQDIVFTLRIRKITPKYLGHMESIRVDCRRFAPLGRNGQHIFSDAAARPVFTQKTSLCTSMGRNGQHISTDAAACPVFTQKNRFAPLRAAMGSPFLRRCPSANHRKT